MAFDLTQFRKLVFDRRPLPDHPIANEDEARKMLADLPAHDPAKALAELTHWVVSMNENDSFSPGRRARVLMEIDVGAHPLWRPLGAEFLAPGGKPLEAADGDSAILHALSESASEFANGFRLCLTPAGLKSRWLRKNLQAVTLRRARWHTRKMILSRMLRLPGADDRWTELHELYNFASEHGVLRNVTTVFPGSPRTSSVRQEYLGQMLADLARTDRMLARNIELIYRIIGRVSASVKLEAGALPGALHAVVPEGASRPVTLAWHPGKLPDSTLYIDATNALPRLQNLLERDMDRDPAEPDAAFGEVFTIRERRTMIELLIDHWGAKSPLRRSARIAMRSEAIIRDGFQGVAGVLVPAASVGQGGPNVSAPESRLRIQMNNTEQKAQQVQKVVRATKGQLLDASTSGMGMLVARRDAGWARLGALLAVCIVPGSDWVVGALRRINSDSENLRLGINVLSRRPRIIWLHLESTGYVSAWDEEKRFERNFSDYFQRGILLEDMGAPLVAGEMLLAPGQAARGSRFDVSLAQGIQRLLVTAVRDESHDFQRVAFDPLEIVPFGKKGA